MLTERSTDPLPKHRCASPVSCTCAYCSGLTRIATDFQKTQPTCGAGESDHVQHMRMPSWPGVYLLRHGQARCTRCPNLKVPHPHPITAPVDKVYLHRTIQAYGRLPVRLIDTQAFARRYHSPRFAGPAQYQVTPNGLCQSRFVEHERFFGFVRLIELMSEGKPSVQPSTIFHMVTSSSVQPCPKPKSACPGGLAWKAQQKGSENLCIASYLSDGLKCQNTRVQCQW